MFLYEAKCGCKFEPCGAATYASDDIEATCGCKFHPCGWIGEGNNDQTAIKVDGSSAALERSTAKSVSEQSNDAGSGAQQEGTQTEFIAGSHGVSSGDGGPLYSERHESKYSFTPPPSPSSEIDFRPFQERDLGCFDRRPRNSIYGGRCGLQTASLVGGYPNYEIRKDWVEEGSSIFDPDWDSQNLKLWPEAWVPEPTDLVSFHAKGLDLPIAKQEENRQRRRARTTNAPPSTPDSRWRRDHQPRGNTNGPGNHNTRPPNNGSAPRPQGTRKHEPASNPTLNRNRGPHPQVGPQTSNESCHAVDGSAEQSANQELDNGSQDSSKEQSAGVNSSKKWFLEWFSRRGEDGSRLTGRI